MEAGREQTSSLRARNSGPKGGRSPVFGATSGRKETQTVLGHQAEEDTHRTKWIEVELQELLGPMSNLELMSDSNMLKS